MKFVSLLLTVSCILICLTGMAAPHAGQELYIVQLEERPLVAQRQMAGVSGEATGRPARIDPSEAFNARWLAHIGERQAKVLEAAGRSIGRAPQGVHEYRYALAGFSVALTPAEAARVARLPGVLQVERSTERQLHGDAGPAWIGADEIWKGTATGGLEGTKGEGVIIGVIDSGIEYTHPAFAEKEGEFAHQNPLGERNYLGLCDPDDPAYDRSVTCNEKLIGMWNFADGPGDSDGHGTKTASIAAGIEHEAYLRGPATELRRVISGVAPHANIIAYDACSSSCSTVSLLNSIDQAVADGVDVILYAIGGFASDPWASLDDLALISAAEAGISVMASVGQSGPAPGTVSSPAIAPWVVAVGTATHDRLFSASLFTEGGTAPPGLLTGRSLTTAGLGPVSIVHAVNFDDGQCLTPFPAGTWDGQIVVCDRGQISRVQKGMNVAAGGAGGFVLANTQAQGEALNSDLHVLPAVHLGAAAGDQLRTWLSSGAGHLGTLDGASGSFDSSYADLLPAFNSRGPNTPVPDVLKPNLVAPNDESFAASIAPDFYGILVGSSAAAASAAGSAALLRALHPSWSPAAIRSALETTAHTARLRMAEDGEPAATPFDRGSGRIELREAARVGLVLEVTGQQFRDADPKLGGDPSDLNLAGVVNDACVDACSWTRTVSGLLRMSWTTSVSASRGLAVTVKPEQFDLAEGGTQELAIQAEFDPDAPRNSWLFAEILLQANDGEIPDQHLTLAVQAPGPIFNDGFEGE